MVRPLRIELIGIGLKIWLYFRNIILSSFSASLINIHKKEQSMSLNSQTQWLQEVLVFPFKEQKRESCTSANGYSGGAGSALR